jgi:hypothetical protein
LDIINQSNKVLNNSELIGIKSIEQNESKTNAEFVFGIKIFNKFKIYFEIKNFIYIFQAMI